MKFSLKRFSLFLISASMIAAPFTSARAEDEALEIATINREDKVDFEKEILPIFRKNCLACHNSTDAESDLILETPTQIIKGGAEGPGVVAGNSAESLVLQLAARQRESYMPPDDNDVGAKQLTSQELGLIKLWIDQGATGEVKGLAGPVEWQPLPAGVNPIYAVAVSADGRFAAAGRANQIFIYHVPTQREIGRLSDTNLIGNGVYDKPGVAFLDLVQSLAFSPNGDRLAAGGYRTVKVWKRQDNVAVANVEGIADLVRSVSVSADTKLVALGLQNGSIQVVDAATGKQVRTITGHTGPVRGVVFNADGTQLFSGSEDMTVRQWNVADGAEAKSITTPAVVNGVALVLGGTQVASAGADNIIRTWALDGDGSAPAKELKGHGGPVNSIVAFGATNEFILSGSQDGTVRHWGAAEGNQVRSLNHGGPVAAVTVSGDGARFASASENKTAKLWNGADGKELAIMKGNFREVSRVEGLKRASALAAKRLDLAKKDLEAGNTRKKSEDDNLTKVKEALTKADEDLKAKTEALVKPTADKDAADKALVEANKTKETAEATQKDTEAKLKTADEALKAAQEALKAADAALKTATDAAKQAADAAKKAADAAAADADNADLKKAAEDAQKVSDEAEAARKKAEEAQVVAKTAADKATTDQKTAADGKKAADEALTKATNEAKAADDKAKAAVGPFQKATDEKAASERAQTAAKRSVERAETAVKKAADAIVGLDASVKTEETASTAAKTTADESEAKLPEKEQPYTSIAFSADGTMVAVGGNDQLVSVFDGATGVAVDNFAGHESAITAVAFVGNNVLAVSDNKKGTLWSTALAWELERQIGDADSSATFVDRVTALDFSSDGVFLATAGGEPSRSGELKVFDVESGELRLNIDEPHSDTIFAVDFSRDGQYIASCGADRFIKVFQAADGAFVRSFEGHTHHVLGVSWSADGRQLASAGADKVVKVWDFRTGDQQRTISGFGKEVTSIHFAGDSVNVVASSGDKNVHIKRADNGGNVRAIGGNEDYVYNVGVTADGKVIVAGGQDSTFRIWKDDGNVIATFAPPQPEQAADAGGEE